MAYTTLLHSGEFVDYNGNTITVEFFKKIDLNANPTSLSFPYIASDRYLTIWSRDGDAKLYDPLVDWCNYRQMRAVQLPGSDYYKYTYRISCTRNNTDEERSTTLHIGIEGMGGVIIDVPLTQASE